MPQLGFFLLGGFEVTLDGKPVSGFRSDKVRALLAYLVVEAGNRPVRRAALADLLWEGFTPDTASHNLRTALYDLRKLLGPVDFLHASRQTMVINTANPDFRCDVLTFESLLKSFDPETVVASAYDPARAAFLREALALYRGEFLAGFKLPDSPQFTAWQQARRQQYARQAQAVAAAMQRASLSLGNLPRPVTPFFNRKAELELLTGKILDADYPLMTVTGEGGVGKTRLALTLAERVGHRFPDGVWFVPLVNVGASDESAVAGTPASLSDVLATAIGRVVSLVFRAEPEPSEQLFRYLAPRRLLLILDNFEHLMAGHAFVLELLQRAPQVTVLITSRCRLDLQAEYVFRLQGLEVLTDLALKSGTLTPPVLPDEYSSIRLFVERAERATGRFKLNAANRQDVIRICRIVDGLPLAIELAAGLTEHRSCADIAEGIAANIDVLSTTLHDVPLRHRSLRAVFEHSWQLLSVDEQSVLARCAVFQGSFTAEAGRAVTGAGRDVLGALTDKSLLRRSESARYSMHSLVRQLAAERLAEDVPSNEKTLNSHSAFYTSQISTRAERLGDDLDLYRSSLADLDDLRAAWGRAVSQKHSAEIAAAARGLSQLYYQRGLLLEAEIAFDQAAEQLREFSDSRSKDALARVLVEQSFFAEQLGRTQEAARLATEVIDLAGRSESADIEAEGLLRYASAIWIQGRYTEALAATERSLAIAQKTNDLGLQVTGLIGLANEMERQCDHARAVALLEQARLLAEQGGHRRLSGSILANLGNCWEAKGDFRRARDFFEEALRLRLQLEDRLGSAIARCALGRISLMLGDLVGAQEQLVWALTTMQEIGERPYRSEVLACLALLWYRRGDLERALQGSHQAVEAVQAAQARLFEAHARLIHGYILASLNRTSEAQRFYHQVLALGSELGHERLDVAALAALAELDLDAGDETAALEKTEQLLGDLPGMPITIIADPFRVYLTCYRVLSAAGDPRAKDIADAAQIRLFDIAGQIPDDALRRRFLEQVPSHRAIAALPAEQ